MSTGDAGADRLPIADGATTARALRGLAAPVRGRLAVAVALLIAGTAVGLVGPLLLGRIVDLVSDGRGAGAITAPALLLLAATALGALLAPAGQALVAEAGEVALADLREQVVAHTLALPQERVERAGAGDLHARVSEDVGQVADAVRVAVPTIATSAVAIVLTIAGLATLDPRFALAGLCAMPLQLYALRWYLHRSSRVYAQERAAAAERSGRLLAAFAGMRTARSLGLVAQQRSRVAERSLDELRLTLTIVRQRTGFFGRLNVAELTGRCALLVAGFLLVRSGSASVGDATAAALYFVRLFAPVNALLGLADRAQQGGASLTRLVGVMLAPIAPEPADAILSRARPAGTGQDACSATLALTGIRHAYVPGREVVRGVDLRVATGERVALVGFSGAGKSTLARIAAGTLEPTAGEVRIGGVALAELGARATRAAIGLVTQEVHVFAGALAEDLRLARPDADDDGLHAALTRVGALAWAQALPDGLATRVGDGGMRLTAVQAQQLALARLVLADPPIAILDEATAEAGSAGAHELERSADAALHGRTALVVAHRLSQAVDADRIVVLEAGRIVEDGPHDVLVHAGGTYASLWSSWSGAR